MVQLCENCTTQKMLVIWPKQKSISMAWNGGVSGALYFLETRNAQDCVNRLENYTRQQQERIRNRSSEREKRRKMRFGEQIRSDVLRIGASTLEVCKAILMISLKPGDSTWSSWLGREPTDMCAWFFNFVLYCRRKTCLIAVTHKTTG